MTVPQAARAFFKEEEERWEIDEEDVGTFVVYPDEVGRRALRPRPSWDPDDPLNWNRWQKYKAHLTISIFAFLATANTVKFTAASSQLSHDFGLSALHAKFLTAFNFLALGGGNVFWAPLSRTLGRRIIILVSLPILVGANIWSTQTHQYDQLLASSVLSCFASSAAICIGPAVVADLFYVHERASALTWYTTSLLNGLFVGTLINGLFVSHYGWRLNCYWVAIVAGLTWFLGIYAVQESSYHGRDILKPFHEYGPKKNHWRRMEIGFGSKNNQTLYTSFRSLVGIAAYPAVFWAALTIGVVVASNIFLRLSIIRNLTPSPTSNSNHSPNFLALISLSPLIGSLLSFLPFGKGLDILSSCLTKKHNRTTEPEYKLSLLLIPIFLGGTSLVITGFTLPNSASSPKGWIFPVIAWGIHGFAATAMSNLVLVYAVDSYKEFAGEIGALVGVGSGVFECVAVLWGEDLVRKLGAKRAYGVLVVQCFVALWGLVFLCWGKRVRLWTARWGVLSWERGGRVERIR